MHKPRPPARYNGPVTYGSNDQDQPTHRLRPHHTDITAIRTATTLLPTPGEQPMILRTAQTPPLDLDALLTAEWRIGGLW